MRLRILLVSDEKAPVGQDFFSCSNCNYNSTAGDSIAFDVDVIILLVFVFGMENCQNAKVIDRIKWFEGLDAKGLGFVPAISK